MHTIAIHHIKGGVGKTTAAVNLAYLAARGGSRVLLWDLDPQGAATFHFRVRPKLAGGARNLVRPGHFPEPHIRASDFHNLDLLPADFSLRNLDLYLDRSKKPRKFIARVCADLAADYDLLFVDCPPGFSLLTESIYRGYDSVMVPIIPAVLSLHTLEQLRKFSPRHKGKRAPKLLPFLSLVDIRKRDHLEMAKRVVHGYEDFLHSPIPSAAIVEQMGCRRLPLEVFAPKTVVAASFRQLWQELGLGIGMGGQT